MDTKAPTRMTVTAINLASLFPDWNSLDSVRIAHSWLELCAILLFAALVVCDVVAHLIEENHKGKAKIFERIGLICFGIAVLAELAAYKYGLRNDELSGKLIENLGAITATARTDAGTAKDKSESAKTEADAANKTAGEAQITAGAADLTAGKAQSKAASALNGAKDAQQQLEGVKAELNRIKSPRSLSEPKELSDELEKFPGTKYTFSGVFNDEESVQFLRNVNFALANAGWVRVKLPITERQTHISLLEGTDDFDVPLVISTGILVSVDSPVSPKSINDAPTRLRMPIIRAAGQLQVLLDALIIPIAKGNAGDSVLVLSGTSDMIRITVGKKP